MKIRDLKSGDRIYLTLNRLFGPVEKRVGSQVIFETVPRWTPGARKSFTQCKGSVTKHTILNNDPALEIQFMSLINPSNTGIARIAYYAIISLWLYEGETNIDTVVSQEISDKRNEFPYAAYQLPPVNIYRKKINLVW